MVALELKSTKKVASGKEGTGLPLPTIVVERIPEVEPRTLYMLSADVEGHGHTGGCPGCAAQASIAWKSDRTTRQRMSRANQNDDRENLDG